MHRPSKVDLYTCARNSGTNVSKFYIASYTSSVDQNLNELYITDHTAIIMAIVK